jgi:TolB-like protein/Tfp pilus assembly protein PilF
MIDMPNRDDYEFGSSADDAPAPSEIRFALQRILDSRTFRAAHAQRRFLRYVVEEYLAGRGDMLKEFAVGLGAFERGDGFDPRVDPIVRTEARKLRARLAKYYAGEGSGDLVRIDLPKGAYLPAFYRGPAPVPAETEPELVIDPTPLPALPELIAPAPEPIAPPPPTAKRPIWAVWVAAAAVVVMGTAAALWTGGVVQGRAGQSARAKTLAVMPIANLSGDPRQDPFVEGMTTSLIDRLSREPGLQVTARQSVARLRGAALPVDRLRSQLGVGALLIGTLEKTNSGFRLRMRLLEEGEQAASWSGSYEFQANPDSAIEAEIAAEAAHALRTGGRRLETLPPAAKVDPIAYSRYLSGLHQANQYTAPSIRESITALESAIERDPQFARAHAALASSWVMAAQLSVATPIEAAAAIRKFASRALELDAALGEAHFSLAVAAQYEYDWPRAEREFRRGLELSPGSATGHLWYAKYLALTGRHREVLVHRTISEELDPLSPYAIQAVGGYWSVMGHYDQAIARFQRALELDPDFGQARQGLGIAYLLKGDRDRAITELETAARIQGNVRTKSLLGYAYGRAGWTAKAQAILQEFLTEHQQRPFPALAIAHVYLGLGDFDQAFHWLEKAVDQRDLSATLQWDSLYVPLRSDPRYRSLLKRMKLA